MGAAISRGVMVASMMPCSRHRQSPTERFTRGVEREGAGLRIGMDDDDDFCVVVKKTAPSMNPRQCIICMCGEGEEDGCAMGPLHAVHSCPNKECSAEFPIHSACHAQFLRKSSIECMACRTPRDRSASMPF